eukprot:s3749_g7.t1
MVVVSVYWAHLVTNPRKFTVATVSGTFFLERTARRRRRREEEEEKEEKEKEKEKKDAVVADATRSSASATGEEASPKIADQDRRNFGGQNSDPNASSSSLTTTTPVEVPNVPTEAFVELSRMWLSNQWESACDVLCKLGSLLSLQLDSVAYSTTISSFGTGPWPQATFLLGGLLQSGLQADVISFNASMGSRPKTWRVAQGLMKTMRIKMIRSTVVTWGSLLRLSPWRLAQCSLASAASHGAELNDWCRATAGGPWPLALGVLLDAEKVPNTLAANAVMKRLREAGQWQLSSELLGLMEADITSYDEVLLRAPRHAVQVLEMAQLESGAPEIGHGCETGPMEVQHPQCWPKFPAGRFGVASRHVLVLL